VDGCDLYFDELREEFLVEEPLDDWLRRTGDLAALPHILEHMIDQVCPSRLAALRDRIDQWLAEGRTSEEVLFRLAGLRNGTDDDAISPAEFAAGCQYVALGQAMASERWRTDT
jgi:hypothetical protein